MTARRIAFRVEYDGTGRHGWQVQPGLPTIQSALNEAITHLVGAPVAVDGASRTDAGVHARGQLAAVTLDHPIPPHGFVKAVNRRLPEAVALRHAWEVGLDFEPRFANIGKTYLYRLYADRRRRPLIDRYAWRVPYPVDPERVADAMRRLLGHHDFTSFASRDGDHRHGRRTLYRWRLDQYDGELQIRVSGTAFMKHMVRTLAGTLVDVGRGRLEPADVDAILAARDRQVAGPKAPARGLTLERVHLP